MMEYVDRGLAVWHALPFHSCSAGALSTSDYLQQSFSWSAASFAVWWIIHAFVHRYDELLFGPLFRLMDAARAKQAAKSKSQPSDSAEKDRATWCCKVVSLMHALIAIYGSFTCLGHLESGSSLQVACETNTYCQRALSITAGYMVYDAIISYQTYGLLGWPTLLLHHVNIFTCFGLGLWGNMGMWVMAAFMTNEISTPFLQLSWLLLKLGQRGSVLFICNAVSTLVCFVGSRFLWNLFVVYRTWNALQTVPSKMAYTLSFAMLVHAALNFYWCFLLMRQASSMVGGKRTSKKKDAKRD